MKSKQNRKNKKPRKRPDLTWLAFLLTFLCFLLLLGTFLDTEGSGFGTAYYAGPVLPMTSLNGSEGVEVTRDVDFDFSPYQEGKEYTHRAVGAAEITDGYILTNTTGESKQLDLVYGFQGSFIDKPEEIPTITVDGQIIQPKLYPSVDLEEKLRYAGDFDAYKTELTGTDYLDIAMGQPEEPDIPVTAYHFTELAYNDEKLAVYPMLTLRFSMDENTSVWSMYFDWVMNFDPSFTEEDGKELLMFRVDRGEAWLFTMGGTLQDLEIGGNTGYNLTEDSATDGVSYKLEVFETTLMDAIRNFAEDYDYWAIEGNDYYPNPGCVTPDILIDDAIKRIYSKGYLESSGLKRIGELFNEVITESRMMYLVFPVELEAGQSAAVEATYIQEPSSEGGGPKNYRESFDLATKLGSDLYFTGLTSSLSNLGSLELGKQNFGFDLEKGITEVTLDLAVERYYLEVRVNK